MPWSPLPTADGDGGRGPAPVSGLLDAVLAGLGAPGVDVVVTVHQRWAEIVGEEVADHVRPLGIEAGRLKVAADGPAWAPTRSPASWSASCAADLGQPLAPQ
jgi:hypothetical protein